MPLIASTVELPYLSSNRTVARSVICLFVDVPFAVRLMVLSESADNVMPKHTSQVIVAVKLLLQ